ncbi:MAG: DUF1566 domain-containing protein [Treponema sp.]|jgi:hypothetical protein|nr:DUF1566 domain-containing protein [Treponema sp.]
MKTVKRLLGIAVIVTVIGLVVTACDESHTCEFTGWEISTTANCKDIAIQTGTCSCGETTTRNEPDGTIDASNHDHSIVAGSGSLICRRTNCEHQYAIGDIGPAGGIIFYVADGQNGRQTSITVQASPDGTPADRAWTEYTAYYLEAAKTNEGVLFWDPSPSGTLINGVTTLTTGLETEASLLGNGRKDTQLIVNHLVTTDDVAAKLCANRTSGGTDWFLPSLGELNQLYLNKEAVSAAGGSFTSWFYWSSSQYDARFALKQRFDNGKQYYEFKNDIAYHFVHAVRAF